MAGLFSRLKSRDGAAKSKSRKGNLEQLANQLPQKPRWEDAWTRSEVEAGEVQELIKRCTEEIKTRGLDHPFLLLPFRPTSDPSAVRNFIRHFFDGSQTLRGDSLAQELRMAEPMVISGVIKWCWSRLPGGVVGWDSYELFKVGEHDSQLARDSFKTFIPLSVDNPSRSSIIFDFFDLLSALAAHGKVNGFGGRKLSRMAGWWAFEHRDNGSGSGFESGYKDWLSAADAASHLFFAYLRSLAPQTSSVGGISRLPMSLQKLLQETEYPPQRPFLLQSSTNKVVMIVETVSPTPFALLRRANHFEYREEDRALQEWSEYDDPVQALTEECRRVLRAISAANQSQAVSSSKHSTSLRDASWSRFEDIGFTSALDDDEDEDGARSAINRRVSSMRSTPASGIGLDRPTTPSWADFLSSGFVDDGSGSPTNLLLPPDKILPPIATVARQKSSQSHRPRLETDPHLEPGELASISRFDLDDSFWWVWMSSLAPEETAARKAVFGRCAVVETVIRAGRWLVMEEMVKGAAPEPDVGAYIAEKKSFFSWARRSKGVSRSKSAGKQALSKGDSHIKASNTAGNASKSSIAPGQHARIQAAAAQLQERELREKQNQAGVQEKRGRNYMGSAPDKTNSVFTLQPVIVSEASPAMKWASRYDKDALRDAYLSDTTAGRGASTMASQASGRATGPDLTSGSDAGHESPPEVPSKSVASVPHPPSLAQARAEPGPKTECSDGTTAGQDGATEPTSAPPPRKEPVGAGASHQVAAQQAATSTVPDLSPESKRPQRRLQKEREAESAVTSNASSNNGSLRKLFGRNKNRLSTTPETAAVGQLKHLETTNEQTIDLEEPASSQGEAAATAQFEPMERTERRVPVPAPALAEAPVVVPAPVPAEAPVVVPAPVPVPSVPEPPSEENDSSRVNTADAQEAKEEFSRFDQGPLDQPAFVPTDDDSDEDGADAVPPPIARHLSRSPVPSPRLPKYEPEAPTAAPALDRWAQIRKVAAERALQRQNEERSAGTYSRTTTEGDGDASGEETIEARVARIKARVAELTGNVEAMNSQVGRTPRPQSAASCRDFAVRRVGNPPFSHHSTGQRGQGGCSA